MRILSSGLLLGAGVVAAVYGLKVQEITIEFNRFMAMGLALMSLGLFALRVNMNPGEDDVKGTYIPGEFNPDS